MIRIFLKAIIVSGFLLLNFTQVFSQHPPDSFRSLIVVLPDLNHIENTSGMEGMDSSLHGKEIIGVGEATHGSREFILAKSKLFLYLHRRMQFHDLAIEMPFSIGPSLTNYINGKVPFAFIDSLLKPAKTLYSDEFFSFLDILKRENQNLPEKGKITIWGLDLDQYYDYAIMQLRLIARQAGEMVLTRFESIVAPIPQNFRMIRNLKEEYTTDQIQESIRKLEQLFSELALEEGTKKGFIIKMCIKQLTNSFLFFKEGGTFASRDRLMFENIIQIKENLPTGKLMIWAHNLHIRKNSAGSKQMGEYLSHKLGTSYYSIGSVFSEGEYRVWYKGVLSIMHLPAITSGKMAAFLHNADAQNYYFTQKSLLRYFKDRKVDIHQVGILQKLDKMNANKQTLYPFKDFDAYFYFKEISALKIY